MINESIDERYAKSVIYRHCLDCKYKRGRSWNEVGRLIRYSGTMSHEFYLRGIRRLRREFQDVFEYLADIYIRNQRAIQTDRIQDIIFDCLTPPDPTPEEMEELQIPPSYEKYKNLREHECISISCLAIDNYIVHIKCSLINSYMDNDDLCVVFRFDGASNCQDLKITIDEITVVHNGVIKNISGEYKTTSEAKAIVFRTLRFGEMPFELSEHDNIDVYSKISVFGGHGYRDNVHFPITIGTKESVAQDTIYPNGRPFSTIGIEELGFSIGTRIILTNWKNSSSTANLDLISKLSYSKLKKMYHMTNDAIEEIREKLSEYGLELKGYKRAQRERARKRLLKEQAFVNCLSNGGNVRLLRVVPEAIIFEITPYMLDYTESIIVKSVEGKKVNLIKTITFTENDNTPLSYRIDLSEELLNPRAFGDLVEIEYEVHIKEYDYISRFVETIKLGSVYNHIRSDYSTAWDTVYKINQFIKIRHLASYVHNGKLCMLFHIENNWISYADISFDYLVLDNARFELMTSEQSVDGNSERLFYVLVDNQNCIEIEGGGIVRMQIDSYEEDIPVNLSCIFDENYRLSYRNVESLNYKLLSLNEPMYATDGNLVLNKVAGNKDEINMEFSYLSALRGANGRLILFINGDIISDNEFKYYKNNKHRILVSLKREKLDFLGVLYNSNSTITIRFIQLDYLGKYKKHKDFTMKINIADLILKSSK